MYKKRLRAGKKKSPIWLQYRGESTSNGNFNREESTPNQTLYSKW